MYEQYTDSLYETMKARYGRCERVNVKSDTDMKSGTVLKVEQQANGRKQTTVVVVFKAYER